VRPIAAAAAVDQHVAGEERQRPGSEAARHRVGAADVERLLGELERERADQHAGAEAHDQADRALGRVQPQARDGAHHQRAAGDEAPERGLEHRL
jgi:hypothetical protein